MSIKRAELNNSKANVCVKVSRLKRKLNKAKAKNQKTIESFISKRRKSKKLMDSLRCTFNDIKCDNDEEFDVVTSNLPLLEVEKKENGSVTKASKSVINISDDIIHESDLSDIVDDIIQRAPITKTATVANNVMRLVFDRKFSTPKKKAFRSSVLKEIHNNCSTPRDSPNRTQNFTNISKTSIGIVNKSYFFEKLTEDCDAFEMSLNNTSVNDIDSDRTENYSVPVDCSLPTVALN